MKRRGFLASEDRDGIPGYSLTPEGETFFSDGDQRVLEQTTSDGRWVLASFSVPEARRSDRYKIRAVLTDLGFGQESAGLMIAPSGLAGEAERALVRDGLENWVSLWVADFGALGDVRSVIERAWDLQTMRAAIDQYTTAAEASLATASGSDSDGFVSYMHATNGWRELSYINPGLPTESLPDDWPQDRAQRLFDRVESELLPIAQRHVDSLLAGLRVVA